MTEVVEKPPRLTKKGTIDKRSITSKINAQKAREVVVKALRKTFKPEPEYETESESDYSESEPEQPEPEPEPVPEPVKVKKPKKVKKKEIEIEEELDHEIVDPVKTELQKQLDEQKRLNDISLFEYKKIQTDLEITKQQVQLARMGREQILKPRVVFKF